MTKFALLGAAALAATAFALPASAQQVISNPGYCAQFYPNANCQNNGENSPYRGDYQRRGGTSGPLGFNNPEWNGGIVNGGNERRARRSRS
jgi:hypothetical protein